MSTFYFMRDSMVKNVLVGVGAALCAYALFQLVCKILEEDLELLTRKSAGESDWEREH